MKDLMFQAKMGKDQDLTPQNRVIASQSCPWGTEMSLNELNSKLDQKRRRVPQEEQQHAS